MFRTKYHLTMAVCLLALPCLSAAETPLEKLPDGAKVIALEVRPITVELTSPFSSTQLVVTAKLASGDLVDVTRIASLKAPAQASVSPTGVVQPTADGMGTIGIALGDQSLAVPVKVSGSKAAYPVSFVKDVQPVLSKLGCNAGTCHGAAQGKVGFKLSLRGYDPIYDHRALTDDLEARRFNRAAPERSLMLMKPAGAVPHVGGVLCQPGEPYYELIKSWIADGVKLDLATKKTASIEIFPKNITIPLPGMRQQFSVVATYPDGSKRDVSAETFIVSSNTEVATVDKAGIATAVRRGETTMLARYEGAYTASVVVVMADRTGFAWVEQPRYNWIDELVDAKLKQVKIQLSPLCDDADFLRRVYIDLTGLPPTADETRKFLADARPTQAKREATIEELVGKDPYVEYWTNKWADLLQVNRKFLGDPGAIALRKWIRNAIATNQPYDKFSYELLTTSGSNVEHPPAAYFKVLQTPDAVMENTTQLFLAVRFNCNKCHDHPFEKWTQDQYYEMTAYFAQVKRTEDPKFKGQRLGGTAVEGGKPLAEMISDAPTGETTHERTGQVAPPKFPFVHKDLAPTTATRRVQAAKWITSKENQYFAKSYVNRIWSYLVGVGIIEPVDDIRAGNPPSNPELLERLTKEFVDGGFDTQKLVKTICKSRTYQLSINSNRWNKDDDINFSHALPRRLPAEVLFDAIHRATGSLTRLPGLPPGARAAQLLDSNVDLPGGFLELFGKPVRESACECERSNTMMLGPVLAMVNGPIVGDAIKDPNGHINKFTLATKDDARVIEEIYMSVLNRKPTPLETTQGIKALLAAGPDHAKLMADYRKKADAVTAYQALLDAKQKAWEDGLRSQKPTEWLALEVKSATSKTGATPAALKDGSTLKVQADKSILASGKIEPVDNYTVVGEVTSKAPITAIRLEVLTDPSLPAKGPGRAENGNFVLNELKLTSKALEGADEKAKPVKLQKPKATFEQPTFPVANAIDNNPATGWAIAGGIGTPQAAIFEFAAPIPAVKGVQLTTAFDQRFGTGHTIGKFRLSVTTSKNPLLTSPISAETAALLDTPVETRTPVQQQQLRQMYVAQDQEYQRLVRIASDVPPSDARVLGAQDLVWALINSPAFLFNH